MRKIKSGVRSLLSPSGVSTRKSSPVSSSPQPSGWKNLHQLLGILDRNIAVFGPIREVLSGLVACIDKFEMLSTQRREYNEIQEELESIFIQLREYCSQDMPPPMTTTLEGLCAGIQREILYLKRKQGQGGARQLVGAEDNVDGVLECYRRIQRHLQRVALNMNLSMWKTLDKIAVNSQLDRMSPSLSALYASTQATELKRGPCTKGTRMDLLAQILAWIDSSTPGSVYWISGMAGTGKTTIAYSLCQELETGHRLAASFFCSRLLPECRDVSRIIPSIAYQLARFSYPFQCALCRVLDKEPDIHRRLLSVQFENLIVQPLIQVKNTLPEILVVLIDALDECENQENTGRILGLLLAESPNLPVKFILSSRPEPEIRGEMTKQTNHATSRVILHELDNSSVQADIETYLRAALEWIEPSNDDIATLVRRSGVLFIYAATVVRYIGYNNFRGNWNSRLQNVLNASSTAEKQNKEIDELYSTILQSSLQNPDLESTDVDDMRQVLHTVICAQEPLTISILSQILRMDDIRRVRNAIEPLWSVLHVSGSNELVTTLHTSFPDYMLDSTRSGNYYCDSLVHNQLLASRCFDFFREMRPQFNVCNLESSFMADDKVAGLEERVKQAINEKVFYAARYWALHLYSAPVSPTLIEQLEEFLSLRLLLWMEVMNLKGCKGGMPGLIQMVEKWSTSFTVSLRELIYDSRRFTTKFSSSPVPSSTPHIYTSMLPFWPISSPISKLYTRCIRGMIELEGTAIERLQPALLAVWHYPSPESPTFSPDSSRIAVRVQNDVILLDPAIGQAVPPQLEGHLLEGVNRGYYLHNHPIKFSPDGALVVSTVSHASFHIWDMRSGKRLLSGETGHVRSMSFSPNGTCIAFGLEDGSVDVLNPYTGHHSTRLITGENNLQEIVAIRYSPDGRFLIACNRGEHMIKWDDQGRQVLKTSCQHEGEHPFELGSVDISPDCTRVASESLDIGIYIWDIETGRAILGPLRYTTKFDPVMAIAYSSDGLYLASGSIDGAMCIWNALTGGLLRLIPDAHTHQIESISFSPDGAYIMSSSFSGRTIRLWDARSKGVTSDPLPGHSGPISSVGFSSDGLHIVSGARDYNVCVWDANSGELVLEPKKEHPDDSNNFNVYATYSNDGARIIVLTSTHPLDASPKSRIVLHPVHRPSAFQPAALSEDRTHHISELSPHSLQVLASNEHDVVAIIHPPIGGSFQCVTATSRYLGIRSDNPDTVLDLITYDDLTIYDAFNGSLLSEFHKGKYVDSRLVQLSPDGTRMVRVVDSGITILDAESGEIILGPLKGHTHRISSVHLSPDGRHIVSGGLDYAICVWDASTGQRVIGPVKWHTNWVNGVRFSPDSMSVVSGSDDKTIRVTDVRAWASIFVPDSLAPTGSDWELSADGWAIDGQGRLLTWVPPEMHTVLMYPRTKLIISRDGWLRMDFSGAYLGESWAKCYRPRQGSSRPQL